MIISSIAGNNVGVVTTIGVTTAIAALVLLIASVSSNTSRLDVFDEANAQILERQIAELVKTGTDETALLQTQSTNKTPNLPLTLPQKLANI